MIRNLPCHPLICAEPISALHRQQNDPTHPFHCNQTTLSWADRWTTNCSLVVVVVVVVVVAVSLTTTTQFDHRLTQQQSFSFFFCFVMK